MQALPAWPDSLLLLQALTGLGGVSAAEAAPCLRASVKPTLNSLYCIVLLLVFKFLAYGRVVIPPSHFMPLTVCDLNIRRFL